MAKVKIHELAKELSMESKEVIRILQKMGCEVKSHMSAIDESFADKLRHNAQQKPASGGKGSLSSPSGKVFVPTVRRIPKAVIKEEIMEQTLKSQSESALGETPFAPREAESKPLKETADLKKEAIPTDKGALPLDKEADKDVIKKGVIKEEVKDADKEAKAPVKAPYKAMPGEEKEPAKPEPKVKATLPEPGKTPKEKEIPAAGAAARTLSPAGKTAAKPSYTQGQTPVRDFKPTREQPSEKARSPRPASSGQDSRPQRPAYQGAQGQRPAYQGAQGQRPAYQGAQGQKPAYQGQGQKPPYRGQGQKPPYQGQDRGGFGGKDKDGDDKGRFDNRKTQPAKGAAPKKPALAVGEKPTVHRQEKKVFVKDIKQERITRDENAGKRRDYKGNKNVKGKNYKGRYAKQVKKEMPPVVPKKVIIDETVALGELAKSMGKTAAEVIKKLFEQGILATINQELDSDTAILIAGEFGITVEVKTDKAAEIMEDLDDDIKDLKERPPVVTVMGHVDHGKTSLLDAIRKTNVISTEAGGITQHIGAYQVEIKGKKITFLDTPGHEAFTSMRARGAQVTDIAILVVAADDGVMPQTIEAINHSKAAGVPIIIAINKIDKPAANPDRVKQELMEHGLVAEEWGGEAIMVPVSAKAGTGIDSLLEMILLVAEVGELKANPKRQARGTVIEAQLDKTRGPVATLLVQKGTIKVGDSILAGAVFGKVKAMNDDKGRAVRTAGPSTPVEVLGFSEVPPAGEVFISVKEDKDARLVAGQQQIKKREEELRKTSKVSLDDLFKQIAEGEIKELNIIIKADVQGSSEALRQALTKLNTDEVKINVIHSGVGGISESDIMLASASNAIIIGFNVRPDNNSRKAAEQESVDMRMYRVIYDAIEDIKKAMAGLLEPEFKENIIGHAQVRTIFKVPKAGMVGGSYITDGKITRNALVRVLRDSVVISETKIDSLRRFKDDVKEVQTGFECGIGLENFNDLKENDVIEAYIMEEVKREL